MNTGTIEIALCDDQQPVMEHLEEHLKKYFQERGQTYRVRRFDTPSDVFAYMNRTFVHILFIDLEFGTADEDGILWAKKIHVSYPDTLVLILTAYEQRYKEGYRAQAFRFMTKPLIRQEFEENMNDCLRELEKQETIQIHYKGSVIAISVKNIVYLEAYAGGTTIHTSEGHSLGSDSSLRQWEEWLSEASFFRVHKRYLVNLAHITDIVSTQHEIMAASARLPVARRKWTQFLSVYMRYEAAGKLTSIDYH